ncbi:hypothetical protein RCH08_002661 [Janthinobacterium sp. CG_S6]|nr:hypothetical protein [Janthinobacterium sp. CG_S6]
MLASHKLLCFGATSGGGNPALVVPEAVRLFDEFPYAAGSWPKPWRVLLKAEVMALGENRRFMVTSLHGLDAGILYEEIYCTRGQSENFIKHLKGDLASDRTSCTTRSPSACSCPSQRQPSTRPDSVHVRSAENRPSTANDHYPTRFTQFPIRMGRGDFVQRIGIRSVDR